MPSGTATARIDDQSFTAMLQESMPALRSFLLRLCDRRVDADDLLQETLAKAWRLRSGYDPRGNGLAWLHRAAFRTFCDHRKRTRRQPASGHDLSAEPAATSACRTELRDELHHRLAALPAIERSLLLDFHRDGLSLRELADRHALPVNTVKSHLHRARQRLRDAHAGGAAP